MCYTCVAIYKGRSPVTSTILSKKILLPKLLQKTQNFSFNHLKHLEPQISHLFKFRKNAFIIVGYVWNFICRGISTRWIQIWSQNSTIQNDSLYTEAQTSANFLLSSHRTEYFRNISEIFPIFHCKWKIVATFLSNIQKSQLYKFNFLEYFWK